jgi:glucosamine kinase
MGWAHSLCWYEIGVAVQESGVRYVVGVDGGGTSCRVAVADLRGRVLGSAAGGPANIRTDLPGAQANIMAALAAAAAQASIPREALSDVVAVLGLAGANVGDYAQRLTALLGFADTLIVPDGLIAVQGALGARDGVVGIIGTGSVFGGRCEGRTRLIGGWGFPLTDQVLAAFAGDPRLMVEKLVQATPGFYASYVPALIAAAEAADPVALAILLAGAQDVERMLDAVMAAGTPRICLLGGLAATYATRLGARYRRLLTPALGDALDGAVMMAAARAQARDGADA